MDDDFSIDAPYSPVIAVLFLSKERVEVAVEGEPDIHCFATENSDAGLSEFEQQLSACKFWARPIITLCMSPDGAFEGRFFQEMHAAPLLRHIFPQPRFLAFADSVGRSPFSAETLLLAFRELFPRAVNLPPDK